MNGGFCLTRRIQKLGLQALPLLIAASAFAEPEASAPFAKSVNSLSMEFVQLPPGEFVMGSPKEDADAMLARMKAAQITDWYPNSPPSETPPRHVKLTRGFAICAHETRLADFRAFVEATGYQTDAESDGRGGDGKLPDGKWADQRPEFNWRAMGYARAEDEPVVNVSWNDAVAFCAWLSKKEGAAYRLPTEAEWEYACRAGTTTPFFWGTDENARNDYVWSGANSDAHPHPVMTRKPNPWGLFDMNGNAYEYCSDGWSSTSTAEDLVDPRGPSSAEPHGWIVVRSGSWGTAPMHCRSAFRGSADKTHRNRRDGFRIVRDLP